MRLNPLYDKILAIIILFLVILSFWNLTSPSPMPITQPRIPETYPHTFKSIKADVLAGTARFLFLIYHPPTFRELENGMISFKIYLTNYTRSPIGRGVALVLIDAKLIMEQNINGDSPYNYVESITFESEEILDGGIFISCNRVGVYNVTVEITVRILSILVIGWVPDKVISQQLTTQINITQA